MSDYKTRLLILDFIYRALKHRSDTITMQGIADTFNNWELIPIRRGDAIVGAALRRERELHLVIDPIFQNMISFAKEARKIVDETIAKYNYAETWVTRDHKVGHRLAKILGFKLNVSALDNTPTIHYIKES